MKREDSIVITLINKNTLLIFPYEEPNLDIEEGYIIRWNTRKKYQISPGWIRKREFYKPPSPRSLFLGITSFELIKTLRIEIEYGNNNLYKNFKFKKWK